MATRLAELRYNGAAYGAEKARLTTEMQNWNAIVDADLRALESLREEGRRAGARPAWFR